MVLKLSVDAQIMGNGSGLNPTVVVLKHDITMLNKRLGESLNPTVVVLKHGVKWAPVEATGGLNPTVVVLKLFILAPAFLVTKVSIQP